MPNLFNEDKSLFNVQNVVMETPIQFGVETAQPHTKGYWSRSLLSNELWNEGYNAIGVIGFDVSPDVRVNGCYIRGGTDVVVHYFNDTDSVLYPDVVVNVLWKKGI